MSSKKRCDRTMSSARYKQLKREWDAAADQIAKREHEKMLACENIQTMRVTIVGVTDLICGNPTRLLMELEEKFGKYTT